MRTILVLAVGILVSAVAVAQPATQPGSAAKPADTRTIESTVAALYEVISGPAGPRDWDRFQSLFVPEAHLIYSGKRKDGSLGHKALTPAEYREQSGPFFLEEGFFETALANKIDRFGTIAHVFSTYESRRDKAGKPFARGINSIQLLFDGTRWWLMSVMWDEERDGNPIPEKYQR